MKRFLIVGLALASLVVAGSAYAFEIVEPNPAGNTRIEAGQGIEDTVFTAGQTVDVRGPISDDLFAAGNAVTVDSPVGGNLVAAGSTVVANGTVGGDLIVAGGTVTLGKDAVVTGDVLLFAGTAELLGTVNGKVKSYTGNLTIDGTVIGNVEAQADEVLLGDAAKIGGSLTGTVGKELADTVDPKIEGPIEVSLSESTDLDDGLALFGGAGAAATVLSTIYWLLSMIIVGMILIFAVPQFITRIRNDYTAQPTTAGVVGLLTLIGLPVIFIISLVLLVTIPFAFAIAAVGWILVLLGGVVGNIWIGDLLGKGKWSPLTALAIGSVVVSLIELIPIIGFLISFVIGMVGLGSLARVSWQLATSKVGK